MSSSAGKISKEKNSKKTRKIFAIGATLLILPKKNTPPYHGPIDDVQMIS
jgi:hypothetical protein